MKPHQYLLKILPNSQQSRMLIQMMDFFSREIILYYQLLPAFEKIYENVGIKLRLAAKSYKFPKESLEEHLLMQDLRVEGFKTVNRLNGLDMEHTKFALQWLAKYHAASAIYLQNETAYPETLTRNQITPDRRAMFETAQKIQDELFLEYLPLYKAEHMKDKIVSISMHKSMQIVHFYYFSAKITIHNV